MSEVSKPINDSQIDRLLAENVDLSRRTDGAEANILAAAQERLEAVNSGLDELRPSVDLDEDAARQYQDMTLERGHLDRVIAAAQCRVMSSTNDG